MNAIRPKLDNAVENVVAEVVVPPVRQRRSQVGLLSLHLHYQYHPGCWVNGVYTDRCRRPLTLHEDLSEDAIADLSRDDRRRRLQNQKLEVSSKIEIPVAAN